MTTRILLLIAVTMAASGCVQTRHAAPLHRTDVALGEGEHEYLLRDVEAEASAVHLFGVSSGERTWAIARAAGDEALRAAAFDRLWEQIPDTVDRRDLALVNVSEDTWATNLLLWTSPHLRIRADVIQLARPPEDPAPPDDGHLVAAAAPSEGEAEASIAKVALHPASAEAENERYGSARLALFGDRAISLNRGGYTWIAASAVDPDAATDIAHHYREKGYRADVITGVVDGGTLERVYRVAVGHFMTLDAAEEARPMLPADLPEDAWILRLK